MVRSQKAALAAAVAALFSLGVGQARAAEEEGSQVEKVRCEGVNSCKGHGSCSSARNACAGQNACKGQGFLMLTPAECEAAKAMLKTEKK